VGVAKGLLRLPSGPFYTLLELTGRIKSLGSSGSCLALVGLGMCSCLLCSVGGLARICGGCVKAMRRHRLHKAGHGPQRCLWTMRVACAALQSNRHCALPALICNPMDDTHCLRCAAMAVDNARAYAELR